MKSNTIYRAKYSKHTIHVLVSDNTINAAIVSGIHINTIKNLRLRMLTWIELVLLRKKIHDAFVDKNGKAIQNKKNAGWSLKNTANELGISCATISQDIHLAKSLNVIPEMKNITSKSRALKFVRDINKNETKIKKN